MIKILSFFILFTFSLLATTLSAAEVVCGVRSVTIRGDSAGPVSAVPCPNLNLTLVSVRDYLPASDDDFGFLVFKGIQVTAETQYQINGFSGGEHSIANVDIYSLALPSYVEVQSRQIIGLSQSQPNLPSITIPTGRRGVVIVEIMGYQPAGDHDFEYVINPDPIGGIGFFVTRLERGNSNSKVHLRLTVLTWPQTINVIVDKGFIETTNRQSNTASSSEWATFVFTSPLSYITRGDDDFWFLTRIERLNKRLQTRVTTGGGQESSSVFVHFWSLKFPFVPMLVIPIPNDPATLNVQ